MTEAIFRWIETTTFSIWVRESPSLFAFPGILSLHAIGMGIVAGLNAMIALRVLGVAPDVPMPETTRFFPVLWFGFWINAVSGLMLLTAYPTKALLNPVFYAKLTCIALGLVTQTLIRRNVLRAPDPAVSVRTSRLLAVASLLFWTGAIVSGRLLAYTYGKLMTA